MPQTDKTYICISLKVPLTTPLPFGSIEPQNVDMLCVEPVDIFGVEPIDIFVVEPVDTNMSIRSQ